MRNTKLTERGSQSPHVGALRSPGTHAGVEPHPHRRARRLFRDLPQLRERAGVDVHALLEQLCRVGGELLRAVCSARRCSSGGWSGGVGRRGKMGMRKVLRILGVVACLVGPIITPTRLST